MKKIYFCMLALLFTVILVGACANKATAPAEQEEAVEEQVDVVDSLAVAIQAEAEAVESFAKELE